MGGSLISRGGQGPDGHQNPWETGRRKEIGEGGIKEKKEGKEVQRNKVEKGARLIRGEGQRRMLAGRHQSVGVFRRMALVGKPERNGDCFIFFSYKQENPKS